MGHPPFIDVKFYSGHNYDDSTKTFCVQHSRYVGLTANGEVYVRTLKPKSEAPLEWARI